MNCEHVRLGSAEISDSGLCGFCWKERAEKAERAVKEWIKEEDHQRSNYNTEKLLHEQTKLRLEKAEAAAAEMRATIEYFCAAISADEKRGAITPGLYRVGETLAKHALSSSCGQGYVPRSELDKANACCAELRAWIEETWANRSCCKEPPKMDCGQGWLSPDKKRVLVEALQTLRTRFNTDDVGWEIATKALAQLKEAQ